MYKLAIKKSARKELDDLPDKDFLKIDKAIISLRDTPFPYPSPKSLKVMTDAGFVSGIIESFTRWMKGGRLSLFIAYGTEGMRTGETGGFFPCEGHIARLIFSVRAQQL